MTTELAKDIEHTKFRISFIEAEIEKARSRGFKGYIMVDLKSQLQKAKNRLMLLQIAAS